MTDSVLTAQGIASFLKNNPQFFNQHAEVFSELKVPHPYGNHVISLGERQILRLRERLRELEWRLNEVTHHAHSNEVINTNVLLWCSRLLREVEPQHLPGEIALGLAEQFSLDHVGMRLWNLSEQALTGYGAAVSQDVRDFTDSLTAPYCGSDTEFEAVSWLEAKPQSLALIPLRFEAERPSIGLLVLGSDDPARFHPAMGTMFLEAIGRLASAALRRLDSRTT
jgi:uncharacterized protein YigA (DUF484 family)